MNGKRWSGIAQKIDLGDGFLCLLFVAACLWAFVFGGDWFQYFVIAAVTAGLVIAATMYIGRRAIERFGYRNQKAAARHPPYTTK